MVVAAAAAAACRPAPPPAERPAAFAFGVFGDGPYNWREGGRFKRLIADVNASPASFFIHVGDILWFPCTDRALRERRDELAAIAVPILYTPGDNEWTDCHERITGAFEPLERLAVLRALFFGSAEWSKSAELGIVSQAADSNYAEFVEHQRWEMGGVVFATLHLVGSDNGLQAFPRRTADNDEESQRRTDAAVAWMAEAFEVAAEQHAHAVVIAFHGQPLEDDGRGPPARGYGRFVPLLAEMAATWSKPVLVIHGDSHQQRVDRPFVLGRDTILNLTRLETFGSPDIGWMYVTVDTTSREVFSFETRKMPWRLPR